MPQLNAVAFVFLLLASFGAAYITGHSTISLPFRVLLGGAKNDVYERKAAIPVVGPFLVALLECPACFGFWQGLVLGWQLGVPAGAVLVWGCAISGSNFILARLTGLL